MPIGDDIPDPVRIDDVNLDEESLLWNESTPNMQKSRENRFDIIGNPPYDIIPDILSYMEINERLRLLNISKTWCDKMSAFLSTWSKLIIQKKTNFSKDQALMLTPISHHISDPELTDVKDPSITDCIFTQIVNAKCIQLKKLNLTVRKTWNKVCILIARGIITPDQTVLSLCRNLQVFGYTNLGEDYIGGEIAGFLDPGYDSTILSRLGFRFGILDIADIQRILSACSHNIGQQLRELSINLPDESNNEGMSLIRRYCKRLEILNINDRFYDDEVYSNRKNTINNKFIHPCPQYAIPISTSAANANGKLQEFAVSLEQVQEFIPYFVEHTVTIQSLKIKTILKDSNYKRQQPPWVHTLNDLNNLRSLVINGGVVNKLLSDTGVSVLLSKSPHLGWLHFCDCWISGKHTFTAIENLHHLQKLELWGCEMDEDHFGSMMDTFAIRNRQKSELSSLEEIIFMTSTGLSSGIERLSDILSLRRIDLLHIDAEGIRRSSLVRLSKNIKSHPCIWSIELASVDAADDVVLEHLAAIDKLKFLELNGLDNVSEEGSKYFDGTTIKLILEHLYNITW
ncbi:hypothetical protein BDA99DRAFT_591577 [Phascolomyces articulosus]|uniref:F-box domain-containing protein n=1 Tax=Phascolomyces articulosus TaxID=60185 RepID=A0AAD5K054_9FUNG|nr:hypothetical protein BDA99DRAFT_591577 [Phascolomyces articulosus]